MCRVKRKAYYPKLNALLVQQHTVPVRGSTLSGIKLTLCTCDALVKQKTVENTCVHQDNEPHYNMCISTLLHTSLQCLCDSATKTERLKSLRYFQPVVK